MTRPRKQTVDWFPHSCTHGQTMFVLEQKYGIVGYAFWFKLLELLGNSEGHFLDLSKPSTLEYVQAYTHTDHDACLEILNLLAILEAIDPELFEKKIIWSENFVKGVAQAYRNREAKIPVRPDNLRKKPELAGKPDTETCQKPVEEGEEREEGKERKELRATPPPDGSGDAPKLPKPFPPELRFSCKHFEVTEDYFNELVKDYPGLGPAVLLFEFKKMRDWLDDNPNRHKRTAKGHLKNPKLFIRNWLSRTVVDPRGSPRGSPNDRTARNVETLKRFMGEGNG